MKITKNKKALGNDNIKQEGQRLIVGFVKTEEESDFGAYVCEAENKLDKATHSVEIRQAGLLFTLRQFCHTVEPPWATTSRAQPPLLSDQLKNKYTLD